MTNSTFYFPLGKLWVFKNGQRLLLWQHQFRSRIHDLFSPNKLCFSSIHLHWSLSLYLPDQMSVSPLIQSWKLLADSCTFGFRVYAHKSCRWSTQDRNKILKTAARYSCLTALSPYEHIIFTFLFFTPSFETELFTSAMRNIFVWKKIASCPLPL